MTLFFESAYLYNIRLNRIFVQMNGHQMNEPVSHRDLFLASLDRCIESEEFVPAFYKRFLATSEDVEWKFRNTDFELQNKMLVRSLRLVAAATKGEREGLQELRERSETHDRHHLNIKPELYDVWRDAVIETAREYDWQWSVQIEEAWMKTLTYAINYMVHRY